MKEIEGIYVYTGSGMGIPGLPHEISKNEAQRLGVFALLTDAIQNGSYKPKTEVTKPEKASGGK